MASLSRPPQRRSWIAVLRLVRRLRRRHARRATTTARLPLWVTGEAVTDPAPAEERPLGCGWFDSSEDLRAGLQVREHASPDAVSNHLPLAAWLELHLGQGAGRAAS